MLNKSKMAKYRLKKDLPGIDAGEVVENYGSSWIVKDGHIIVSNVLNAAQEADGWLEPIEEMTEEKAIEIITDAIRNRWRPKYYEQYYTNLCSADNLFEVSHLTWHDYFGDMNKYTTGNCFKTKEEAKRYAEALQFLLDNEPKNDRH